MILVLLLSSVMSLMAPLLLRTLLSASAKCAEGSGPLSSGAISRVHKLGHCVDSAWLARGDW